MTDQVTFVTGPVPSADLPAIKALLQAAYAAYADLPGLPDMTEGLEAELAQGHVIRALQGGVVGLAHWTGPQGGAGHLVQLAVHPAAGGQGIGGRLLGQVAGAAQAAGADRLELGTHEGMTAARRLYARQGWMQTGQQGARLFLEYPLS